MKKTVLGAIALALVIYLIYCFIPEREYKDGDRFVISHKKFLSIHVDIPYRNINKPVSIEHLVLPGTVGRYGVEGNVAKFMRAMRFKELCDAVEDRYNLPQGIIFGMMVQESCGVEFLPNGQNDGGFGLCHMQPINARKFGLKTYKNCNDLVCRDHAVQLNAFIQLHRDDRKLLADTDERLHHLKNLDAVGRMLAYYMSGKPVANLGPLRTALCRYAGSYNYVRYWREVRKSMQLANDPSFLRQIETKFNELNTELLIDGKQGNWKSYLESFHKLNENYGLSEYQKLPKYEPRNSQLVKATYQNFL